MYDVICSKNHDQPYRHLPDLSSDLVYNLERRELRFLRPQDEVVEEPIK